MVFLPTCKEIHRLASEKLDRRLSYRERMRWRMHLLYCTGCRNFNGQLQLIRSAMHRLAAANEPVRESERP